MDRFLDGSVKGTWDVQESTVCSVFPFVVSLAGAIDEHVVGGVFGGFFGRVEKCVAVGRGGIRWWRITITQEVRHDTSA